MKVAMVVERRHETDTWSLSKGRIMERCTYSHEGGIQRWGIVLKVFDFHVRKLQIRGSRKGSADM